MPSFNSLNGYGLDDPYGPLLGPPVVSFNSLNGYGLDDSSTSRSAWLAYVSTA
ncbi:hypothetical protein THIOKS1880003 [Thiocapsa sp. KS1]|nr:hypothetical protein THIOKS1880003 [Thiocapsa sp. KS1]